MLERTRGAEPSATYLPQALLTLAVSFLIALALPAANQLHSWHSFAIDAAFRLGAVILGAGVLWVSWRVVGGRTSSVNFIVAYSFLLAAWLPIFSLSTALDDGAMRLIRPQLFAEIAAFSSAGQDTGKLNALLGSQDTYAMKALLDSDEDLASAIRTPGFLWIMSMAILRGALTFSWLIVSFGAFRKILRLSWVRAAFSLAIFLCFGLIAALVLIFFQMAPVVVDPERWIQKWPWLERWAAAIGV